MSTQTPPTQVRAAATQPAQEPSPVSQRSGPESNEGLSQQTKRRKKAVAEEQEVETPPTVKKSKKAKKGSGIVAPINSEDLGAFHVTTGNAHVIYINKIMLPHVFIYINKLFADGGFVQLPGRARNVERRRRSPPVRTRGQSQSSSGKRSTPFSPGAKSPQPG